LPLLRGITAGATFAYQRGRQVAVEEFLSDVYALAGSLPDWRYVLNVCEDRYHFMVGFGAALLREQVSLLPPNQTPDLIGKLGATYDGLYCLTDGATAHASLETVFYRARNAGHVSVARMPSILANQCAAIVFTSGSTGEPVPSPKTWGSLVASAHAEAERLGLHAHAGMALLGTVPATAHVWSRVDGAISDAEWLRSAFRPAFLYQRHQGSARFVAAAARTYYNTGAFACFDQRRRKDSSGGFSVMRDGAAFTAACCLR
jgi:acyl-CoA synthetase (AMP-forming)/AMP-acid ligase II